MLFVRIVQALLVLGFLVHLSIITKEAVMSKLARMHDRIIARIEASEFFTAMGVIAICATIAWTGLALSIGG